MIHYKSTDEVLSDVQLVWANCRRYNAAEIGRAHV